MGCSACGGGGIAPTTIPQMISNLGSIEPYLQFAYCAYKDQFVAAFKNVGINVNSQADLPKLAQISDNKLDTTGQIKDSKGNPMVFSVIDTLNTIDTSKPQNTNCTMK